MIMENRDDPLPVRADRTGVDKVSMAFEDEVLLSCSRLPYLQRLVFGSGDDPPVPSVISLELEWALVSNT